MLRRDEDRVDLGGHDAPVGQLVVGDGDLGLAIGAQPPEASVLADVGQLFAELVGQQVRQRHAALRLVAGVSEHDALIAGAHVHVVLADVHAPGDVGTLLVDSHQHLAGLPAQPLGIDAAQIVHEGTESDLAHLIANDGLVIQVGRRGDLPEDHDHVVLGGGLAGHLAQRVGGEAGIEDGVGDLIAEFVGMAFVDAFGREEEGTDFDHGVCVCVFVCFLKKMG